MSEAPDRTDKLPFRHALTDSHLPVPKTGIPTYRSFADNPDYVIRESSIIKRDNIGIEIEQAGEFRTVLKKLEEYGLKNPGFSPVIGQETEGGQPTDYIVSQLVRGETITTPFPEQIGRKLFETIARYYLDVATNGGAYLDDLHLNNFVYGKIKDDTEDHLYFVDLDMGSIDHHEKDATHTPRVFTGSETILDQGVRQLEHYYGHDFPEYHQLATSVLEAFGGSR